MVPVLNQIINQLQRDEPHAFDALYQRCSGYVYFVCSKFCDNKEDTEEIVQDTFVIAYKKRHELRSESLLGYLRKIAVHECFRQRKANNKRTAYVFTTDELPIDPQELNESLLPEASLYNKERQRQLLIEISRLPKTQREMIYLYYYIDLDTAQIAQIMECTLSNVYSSLTRARQTIRRKLEEDDRHALLPIAVKTLVLLPLAALFLAEESTYMAAIVPVAAASAATSAGAAATTTTVTTTAATTTTAAATAMVGYILAACLAVACVGAISITTYFALRDTPEYTPPRAASHDTTEPRPTELYVPALSTEPAPMVVHAPEPTQAPALPEPSFPTEPVTAAPVLPEPTPDPTTPEPTPTPAPNLTTAAPTPTPAPDPTTAAPTPLDPTPEPTAPLETTPTPPPPTEPVAIDRTDAILSALSRAHTPEETARIINDYDFINATQMITFTDRVLRFYLRNEGSGDILIGIAANEDGTQWIMRFDFFENAHAPQDRITLYDWMRE